jgi:ribose/xylose/arabinose/galactoside ABC-type transport system permease subunit
MALGLALVISGGVDERSVPFKLISTIGIGRLFSQIPYLVIISLAVALVFGVILAQTRSAATRTRSAPTRRRCGARASTSTAT